MHHLWLSLVVVKYLHEYDQHRMKKSDNDNNDQNYNKMLSRVNTNNSGEDSELQHARGSCEFLQSLAWVMRDTQLPPALILISFINIMFSLLFYSKTTRAQKLHWNNDLKKINNHSRINWLHYNNWNTVMMPYSNSIPLWPLGQRMDYCGQLLKEDGQPVANLL